MPPTSAAKVGENLRAELTVLELSRKLATIDTSLQLETSVEQLVTGTADLPRLRELYTRLELRALLRALGPRRGAGAAAGRRANRPAGRRGTWLAEVAVEAVIRRPRKRDYTMIMSRGGVR